VEDRKMNNIGRLLAAGLTIGTMVVAGCRSVSMTGKDDKMTTTSVRDLNVLAVYVTDLDRSVEFYGKHLGFNRGEDMEPGVLMSAGSVTLYLEASRKSKRDEAVPTAEFSPCFATDSVKASYEALKAAGVRIVSPYSEFAPTFAMFRIADPDGNLIEFAGKP
jgi:catechol 2,3-dioxygenase-like lactoylglutathione lyase family enzyme